MAVKVSCKSQLYLLHA